MAPKLNWELCGDITLDKFRPVFPEVPALAGLYLLKLKNGWWYFGEASNLQKRLFDYAWPGVGVESEHRLFYAIMAADGGTVEVFTQGDLSQKTSRCIIESREIASARIEGRNLLNGLTKGHSFLLEMSIKYHEAEIKKLRARLDAAPKEA